MEKITTNKIAEGVAKGNEIILRNNQITRLVFKPMLLDNENNIKGTFIFQKKGKNDEWEDINEESLSKLKKGEGYQLTLSSEELSSFLAGIEKIKKIYEEYGIQDGKKTFYVTDENVEEILESLGSFDSKKLKEAVKKIDIKNIENTINIAKFEKVIEKIEKNLSVSKEKFWQNLFEEESWILSQIFAEPYVYYLSQAYLGGKSLKNKGGIITDYLYKNNISKNIAIIEIKTPCAKLIKKGASYRGKDYEDENSVCSLHEELTGAISQILNQKYSFLRDFNSFNNGDINPYNIKCFLIIGNYEDLDEENQRKTFELHRQNYKDLEIITFDELLEKIRNIYNLLNDNYHLSDNSGENKKDSLPF